MPARADWQGAGIPGTTPFQRRSIMSSQTMDGQAVRYAPRRGTYATVGLWVVTALLLFAAFRVSQSGMGPLALGGLYLLYGGIGAICMGSLYGLRYALSDEDVRASIGPIGIRVRLEDIESVSPGWLKSPRSWKWGLTVRGLIIRRRGKRMGVGISPDDPETFLRDLAGRCPHLEVRDDGLGSRD
jgi:hypothetical protein